MDWGKCTQTSVNCTGESQWLAQISPWYTDGDTQVFLSFKIHLSFLRKNIQTLSKATERGWKCFRRENPSFTSTVMINCSEQGCNVGLLAAAVALNTEKCSLRTTSSNNVRSVFKMQISPNIFFRC